MTSPGTDRPRGPRPPAGGGDGDGGERPPTTVSPLAVPLFVGALALCAASSYLLGPLGLMAVLAVLIGALVLAVRRPADREAAVAAVAGAVIGFAGIMLIALVHIAA